MFILGKQPRNGEVVPILFDTAMAREEIEDIRNRRCTTRQDERSQANLCKHPLSLSAFCAGQKAIGNTPRGISR
jgi:hypothetical protein